MNEETFQSADGLNIFVRSESPEGAPRGVVVIVHGFKSHSGLYEWPMAQLSRRDLVVYALDLRGHGRSDGERLYVNRFAEYVDDVNRLVGTAKARHAGLPCFVLGHSAGGVVAATYALEHQADIDGLIVESFAYELPAPGIALSVLKGIGHIAPHAHVLALKDEDFSRDPEFVQRMKNDPLIPKISYPAETVAELVRADERLRQEAAKIELPILILHGTADRAASVKGSEHFHGLVSSRDRTLKLYEGAFHDPLADVGRQQVMADVTEWIQMRLPAR